MLEPNTPIINLNRVGSSTAARLKKLGLETVQDLLFYIPFRYEFYGSTKSIDSLKLGETASIRGQIELIQSRRSFKSRLNITEALISDDSGSIKAVWFNQPYLSKNLKAGDHVSLAGKISSSYGAAAFVSPSYEKISDNELDDKKLINTNGLVPVYSLTSGVTQKQLRFLISQALPLAEKIQEWLPEDLLKRLKIWNLSQAIKAAHFPDKQIEAEKSRERLGFAELFLRQLKSQLIKLELKKARAPKINFKEQETKKFVDSLPFTLTPDQRITAWEIIKDLGKDKPMSRLLEGDVGSGKTLVAALALFNVALSGSQGAFMAPTEILAHQHFDTLNRLFKDWPINIALMTGSKKDKNYKNADIIVGTHALIQDKLFFHSLALAIVDEQHRFGVAQRKKISSTPNADGEIPHFLSMTATPIPRSLALAIYGDLDISIIKTKPKNRRTIKTKIVPADKRAELYEFIRQEIKSGRQAFVVCPLIDPSDSFGAKSVKAEHEKLDKEIFPDLSVACLHGKMKAAEKEKIMAEFLNKKTSILVSTSVIEVGVDIPNASIMLIEGAERFGLAQLHQFRGRVGRGEEQSYCFLALSENEDGPSEKTTERLKALEKYDNGFDLAQIDLKLRGGGDIYGSSQSGFPELKIASLFDYALMKKAAAEAAKIALEDPELEKHPNLKNRLGQWEKEIHFE